MTRLEDTNCHGCVHYREGRYPVPTCARAAHPHGNDAQLACVIAWERCEGKYRRARR